MKYTVLALVCLVVVNGYSFKRTEKSKYLGDREKSILKHAGIEMAKEEFGEEGGEEAEKILDNCLEKADEKIGECMLDEGQRLCEGEDDQCKRIEEHILFTIAVGKHLLESGCLAEEVENADIESCIEGKCMKICGNVCDDMDGTEKECDCKKCCKVEEKDLESAVEELESKEEERSTRLNKLRKLNIFRSVLNKRYFGNLIKRK
ncbi:Hypothetical predicted protein [Mytilus galloprovincialis]|nr:Hypothetical predicted protein [Mytilus galloprovincialis]